MLLILPGRTSMQVPSQTMYWVSKLEAISVSAYTHQNRWKCCITTGLPVSRFICWLMCCPQGHLDLFFTTDAPRSSQRNCSKDTAADTRTPGSVCAPATHSLASAAHPSSNATAACPALAFFSLFLGSEDSSSLRKGGLHAAVGHSIPCDCSPYIKP